MKNLTKREKLLMYILVYVLIIVGGGFLLCMPAYESYSKLKSELDTTESQWLIAKAGVVEYKDLDKQIEDATNAYNEQINKFYIAKDTHVEDIDDLLTTLAKSHNLKPMSLQISDITEEKIMSYKDYIQEAAKKVSTNETNPEATEEQKGAKTTTAKAYTVNMVATGTITSLQSLINDVSAIKTLKVSDVTYTSQEDATKTMTLSFKVYMI